MANEFRAILPTGSVGVYGLIQNYANKAQVYNTSTELFETLNTGTAAQRINTNGSTTIGNNLHEWHDFDLPSSLDLNSEYTLLVYNGEHQYQHEIYYKPQYTAGGIVNANVVQVSGSSEAAGAMSGCFEGFITNFDDLNTNQNSSHSATQAALVTTQGYIADISGTLDSVSNTVGNIGVGAGGLSTAATSFTIGDGIETLNDYTDTDEQNETYHTVTADTNLDVYYTFTLGQNGTATSVSWEGYLNANGDTIQVRAYDWSDSTWKVVATLNGANGTTPRSENFLLTAGMTGTGANIGQVRVGFYSTDGSSVMNTDRILVEYTALIGGITNGSVVTLQSTTNNENYEGAGWTLLLNGQDIGGSYFYGAKGVAGSGTNSNGSEPIFDRCGIGNVTSTADALMLNCALAGTLTLTSTAGGVDDTFSFNKGGSAVAGAVSPHIDASQTTKRTYINVRKYGGGLEVTMNTGVIMSHEVLQGGTQTFHTRGGDLEFRGNVKQVYIDSSGSSTSNIHGNIGNITVTGVGGTVNLYGIHGGITDQSSGSVTVNDNGISFGYLSSIPTGESAGSSGNCIDFTPYMQYISGLSLSTYDRLTNLSGTVAKQHQGVGGVSVYADSATVTSGTGSTSAANTQVLDGSTHGVTADPTMSFYYQFNLGSYKGIATSVHWHGQMGVAPIKVWGYDWVDTEWKQVDIITETHPSQYVSRRWLLERDMTDTPANNNQVRLRFTSTNNNAAVYTDRILCEYAPGTHNFDFLYSASGTLNNINVNSITSAANSVTTLSRIGSSIDPLTTLITNNSSYIADLSGTIDSGVNANLVSISGNTLSAGNMLRNYTGEITNFDDLDSSIGGTSSLSGLIVAVNNDVDYMYGSLATVSGHVIATQQYIVDVSGSIGGDNTQNIALLQYNSGIANASQQYIVDMSGSVGANAQTIGLLEYNSGLISSINNYVGDLSGLFYSSQQYTVDLSGENNLLGTYISDLSGTVNSALLITQNISGITSTLPTGVDGSTLQFALNKLTSVLLGKSSGNGGSAPYTETFRSLNDNSNQVVIITDDNFNRTSVNL